jgi:hypothetical protein
MDEKQTKAKVKVYKIENDKLVNKSEDRTSKHLKSKSQSNFNATSVIENKSKKSKPIKTKRYDLYNQNFSPAEYYKHRKAQEGKPNNSLIGESG